MKRAIVPAVSVLFILALLGCGASVADKKIVQMDYTLTLSDGTVYDTSIGEGKEPLEFMFGVGRMIPALEKEIKGLRVKGKKQVTVKAADAYGEYNQAAVQEIPRAQLPQGMELTVGATYSFQTPAGPMPVTIKSASDTVVVMDLNHPLAGKDLTFDVQIVKIRDATKEELAQMLAEQQASAPPAEPAPQQ
jgi:FKBP-type peptidyl-prolyl cis-trans isomerase 2